MSLNRLFDTLERAREAADWRAAFGEAQVVGDKTIIPVAQVGYGFGMGFEGAEQPEEGAEASVTKVGGGGGSVSARPLGALVVTPDRVYFEKIRDESKIALVGLGVGAWSVLQANKTFREIFGRKRSSP